MFQVFQVFHGTGTLTEREARLTERACERLTFNLLFQVFQVFHGTGTLTEREARLTERACERLTECEARLTFNLVLIGVFLMPLYINV